MEDKNRLLTRREGRAVLRLGATKFDELLKCGAIYTIRVGRRVLIPQRALDEFIRSSAQTVQ